MHIGLFDKYSFNFYVRVKNPNLPKITITIYKNKKIFDMTEFSIFIKLLSTYLKQSPQYNIKTINYNNYYTKCI